MVRVLVVDDDPTILLLVRRYFKRTHPEIELVEAVDGEEGLAALERGPFDCILSDYRMGRLTGTDLLVAALERDPRAARVLMCGALDPSIVAEANERAHVHACVEKPMTMGGLETMLAGVAKRFLEARGEAP